MIDDTADTLREIAEALQGIQDALEMQTELLRDVTYYPTDATKQPRLLTGVIGPVEVIDF